MPETWAQATVILALVVPGFIYRASRQSITGPDPEEREFGARILRSIAATAVFAGIYTLCFGPFIRDYVLAPSKALSDIRVIGLLFIVFALLIPWLAARVRYYITTSAWYGWAIVWIRRRLKLRRGFDPTPSAWDFAFGRSTASWVRVRYADGRWIGGWFGDQSYASSFPNPQEIYVQEGWVIDDEGKFTNILHAPGGMIIRCANAVSVDFTPVKSDTGREATDKNEGEAGS